MHRPAIAGLACLIALNGCAAPTPDAARLVTEDIPRFWAAWDAAGGPPDAATLTPSIPMCTS